MSEQWYCPNCGLVEGEEECAVCEAELIHPSLIPPFFLAMQKEIQTLTGALHTMTVRFEADSQRIATLEKVAEEALKTAMRYGAIDGAHHKTWVIDQMVRTLTGDKYDEWVKEAKAGINGPNTYDYDEGIAP